MELTQKADSLSNAHCIKQIGIEVLNYKFEL